MDKDIENLNKEFKLYDVNKKFLNNFSSFKELIQYVSDNFKDFQVIFNHLNVEYDSDYLSVHNPDCKIFYLKTITPKMTYKFSVDLFSKEAKIKTIKRDQILRRILYLSNKNIIIIGPRGIGKTFSGLYFTESEHKANIFYINFNQISNITHDLFTCFVDLFDKFANNNNDLVGYSKLNLLNNPQEEIKKLNLDFKKQNKNLVFFFDQVKEKHLSKQMTDLVNILSSKDFMNIVFIQCRSNNNDSFIR